MTKLVQDLFIALADSSQEQLVFIEEGKANVSIAKHGFRDGSVSFTIHVVGELPKELSDKLDATYAELTAFAKKQNESNPTSV